MSDQIPERFGIRPHQTRKLATRSMLAGAVAVPLGVGLAFAGSWPLAFLFTSLGAIAGWFGWYTRRHGTAAQILNRALRSVTAGEIEDARLLHRHLDEPRLSGTSRRALALQRCMLATREGDLEGARTHADAVIEQPLGWLDRQRERVQIASARSMRAFARAALGDATGAAEDADRVRRSSLLTPDTLARVELAAAVSLQREGRRGALREHLRTHRALLLNHTTGRERGLVRGLERMLASSPESAYRKAAEKEARRPDDWLAKVAPGVASFVPAREAGVAPRPDDDADAVRRAEERLGESSRSSRRWKIAAFAGLGCLVTACAMFVGLYQLVAGGERPPEGWAGWKEPQAPPPAPVEHGLGWWDFAPAVFMVVFLAFLAFRVVRDRAETRRLASAMVQRASGDTEAARAALQRLAKSRQKLNAALAEQQLAAMAFDSGWLDDAAARVEAALEKLKNLRALTSDALYPSLLEDRAVLIAARGQHEEAAAELAALARQFPSYPLIDRARQRVALMTAVVAGDHATAARAVDPSSDVVLSAREDLLVDLCRALAGERDVPGEVDRLHALVGEDGEERAWLQRIAPELLAAFDASPSA